MTSSWAQGGSSLIVTDDTVADRLLMGRISSCRRDMVVLDAHHPTIDCI